MIENMPSNKIYYELEKRKRQITINNYVQLMQERLIPFHQALCLAKGESKTEEEIWAAAHQDFCEAKKRNVLDEFNCLVEN